MADINQKLLGSLLIGLAIILIFILVVVKINNDREGAFLCQVVADDPNLSMDDCPAHESSNSWLITIAFVIVAMLLVVGVILAMRGRIVQRTEGPKSGQIDTSKLDQEEKQIVDLLQQHEGSMYQSDITRATGHTKVKTTRLLDRLEGKGILERRRRGMANIVILK